MLSGKYLQVIKNSWDEYFVYRLNFVMWRVRVVLQLLVTYFLWLAIFSQKSEDIIFGYSESRILTYILMGAFLSAIIYSTRTLDVGDQINRGDLSNFLIRPINYFFYKISQDVSDKLLNILFAAFELIVIFVILRPSFIFQTSGVTLAFFSVAVILATALFFLISFLLGSIGFWSPEVWGPRYLFFVVNSFLAGGLFPLDILPKTLFTMLQFTPFPYLLYFPLKIYLGSLTTMQILSGLAISFLWVVIMYFLVKIIWQKGLSLYEAVGR